MRYYRKLLVLLFLSIIGQYAFAQNGLNIIPLPQSAEFKQGTLTLPKRVTVYAQSADERNVAGFLTEWLKQYGKTAVVSNNKASLIYLSSANSDIKNKEGYQLLVGSTGIKISAANGAGLFYGLQSLMQLVPMQKMEALNIPHVKITDQPAFKWRGVLLDVSRHFFSVAFVKKYIDVLAFYKINTFHWHLTDDQGWRIEIKKYPKLTQVSAFRKETLIGAQQLLKADEFKYDGMRYGGFYTQEEIKDVVAYAQKRYITIVPEIEMPGHSVAVLAAYPELACKSGPYETFTKWGVSEDIVCPSEQTFQFFENVLAEVVQLFPGKYVHIGGDEAPKTVWEQSEDVKKIMKENNITDVNKVQGWFNARIEKFLISKGKQLVGWDEILEGGITPSSVVMSWRGEAGGIEAVKHGNDVVMVPNQFVYLDYGQNKEMHSPLEPTNICCYLPLEKIYNYNPLSKDIAPELQKHVLGTQATLFTEYITTESKAEYMIFPRILALAEVGWTPAGNKNFEKFKGRLGQQFPRLDKRQIIYRIPEPEAAASDKESKKVIVLNSIVPKAIIRFTLDNSIPDETSDVYTQPIEIPNGLNLKIKASAFSPNGRHSVPLEIAVP